MKSIHICLLICISGIISCTTLSSAQTVGTFWWISDVHLDINYDATSNTTTFCRSSLKGPYNFPSAPYGRIGCDSPPALVDAALKQMVTVEPNPDWILVTGDFPAHRLDNQEQTLAAIAQVTKMIKDSFPTTLILPCIGNNDVFPDYKMPLGSSPWTQTLQQLWSDILPDNSSSFLQGGYYMRQVKPNLRAIVLNTVFYSLNRWESDITPADPSGQFVWLAQQLLDARRAGHKVFIAGHIPPGQNPYDNVPLWVEMYNTEYMAIVNPFSDMIVGEYFGHLHTDEFRLLTNPSTWQSAVTSVILGPSISPANHNYPTVRLMMFDPESAAIIDYDQYYMDLLVSNRDNRPVWKVEYSFDQAYGTHQIDTQSFINLYRRMQDDDNLFELWMDHRVSMYSAQRYAYYCALSAIDDLQYVLCLQEGSPDQLPNDTKRPFVPRKLDRQL